MNATQVADPKLHRFDTKYVLSLVEGAEHNAGAGEFLPRGLINNRPPHSLRLQRQNKL